MNRPEFHRCILSVRVLIFDTGVWPCRRIFCAEKLYTHYAIVNEICFEIITIVRFDSRCSFAKIKMRRTNNVLEFHASVYSLKNIVIAVNDINRKMHIDSSSSPSPPSLSLSITIFYNFSLFTAHFTFFYKVFQNRSVYGRGRAQFYCHDL